ncbi:MAG: hypothetical protein ACREYC_08765 [Gammaproteobacteria bacterium]
MIGLALLIPVLYFTDVLYGGRFISASESLWRGMLEPLINCATLFIAAAVWWGEINQDLKNNLPKKLTVKFLFKGQPVMKCLYADLVSEADIRALGQQIGSQMVAQLKSTASTNDVHTPRFFFPGLWLKRAGSPKDEMRSLRFKAPCVTPSGGQVQQAEDRLFFRFYEVSVELTELPPEINPGECWVWRPPFENVNKIATASP